MKAVFYLLIFLPLITLYSCGASDKEEYQSQYFDSNPCQDQFYQSLKKINPDSLTGEQLIYFKTKERDCTEYEHLRKLQGKLETHEEISMLGLVFWVIGSIAGTVILTLVK